MLLNDMTMSDMARVADDLDAVRAAMAVLADRGLVARADLTPGQPMVIRLVRGMPETVAEPVFERVPAPGSIGVTFNGAPVQDRVPDKYARLAFQDLDNEGFAVEPEPTPITAEAPPEGNAGERAEGAVVAAPEPAVTGPGEVEAEATAPGPNKWPSWSEDDTATLIDMVAAAMEFDGLSLRAAALKAAPLLGRPAEGTVYKARSLIERIEAMRREMASGAEVVPEPQPEAMPPAPEPAPEPEPVPAADLSPLTPFGELCQHLNTLPRKRGWSLQRDHDLLHFAELGWKPGEIALELSIPADEIKPRFAMLTYSGRWKRAEVLGALESLLKAQAA